MSTIRPRTSRGTIPAVPYRCPHCGNKTRFDIVETVRSRRFHHYTLGGDLEVEEDETLERSVESVTCRWCNRSDGIEEFSL
jgi:transposase